MMPDLTRRIVVETGPSELSETLVRTEVIFCWCGCGAVYEDARIIARTPRPDA